MICDGNCLVMMGIWQRIDSNSVDLWEPLTEMLLKDPYPPSVENQSGILQPGSPQLNLGAHHARMPGTTQRLMQGSRVHASQP